MTNKEEKEQIAVLFTLDLLNEVDSTIKNSDGRYRNRQHFIELAVREKLKKEE